MKLIHLSDLHLGKRVNEISMLPDQVWIIEEILQLIRQEQPDAVLLAGDIYDKTVPPAEAVTLFDHFLCQMADTGIPVLLVSGNHDSPERLAFASRLLDSRGIHISPVYDGHLTPVTLHDAHGPVDFWLLPFLKPAQVRPFFPEQEIETYTDAVAAALSNLNMDQTRRNVLLTHYFVTGASTCDSEELSIGGSDNVDRSVFEGFDYVALGHLHGPQNVGSNRIRYCGTPLKYSFSEAAHHKSVTLAELGAKGTLCVQLLPLHPRHDLRQMRGSFSQLTDASFYAQTQTQDYLHLILTDEQDIPEAVGRLRLIYPNLMKLTYDNTRTRTDCLDGAAPSMPRKTPLELFEALYAQQNNHAMTQEQQGFVEGLIESIWEDRL